MERNRGALYPAVTLRVRVRFGQTRYLDPSTHRALLICDINFCVRAGLPPDKWITSGLHRAYRVIHRATSANWFDHLVTDNLYFSHRKSVQKDRL